MSAIFGERLMFRRSTVDVELRVWGDEFYARRETLSGYTVVYDHCLGLYCYAQLVGVRHDAGADHQAASAGVAARTSTNGRWSAAIAPPSGPGRSPAVAHRGPDVQLTLGPAGGLLRGRRVSRGLYAG